MRSVTSAGRCRYTLILTKLGDVKEKIILMLVEMVRKALLKTIELEYYSRREREREDSILNTAKAAGNL